MVAWQLPCSIDLTHFPSLVLLSQQKPANRRGKTQGQTHLHSWLGTERTKSWVSLWESNTLIFLSSSHFSHQAQFSITWDFQTSHVMYPNHMTYSSSPKSKWKSLPGPEILPLDVNNSVCVYMCSERLQRIWSWKLRCLWFRGSVSSSPEGQSERRAPGAIRG